ncbi:TonB-dependent receptor plug domain-containing protein [Confluentibacter sediminis]|uniref:TonB-dependent receptor plug domain-containing protein n=1 Tax=Confluentibacter sediminis TaxID=2219045 RepID=UPI000DAE0C62|nr:TonB-dependent receptor [Confluentibacter sediminis]
MYYCKRECLQAKVIVLVLTGVLFINSSYSQNNTLKTPVKTELDTTKVYTLDEVVVSTTIFRQRFNVKSAMPAQILSGHQLEKLNSLSVADAMRYFSGVQLKDYGGVGGIKTINVRSLGSAHTAVFYDGMNIGNAQNGQVDLGKYTLDNIESIELYNGQKSSIFQPAKGFFSSNTLFLKTKSPHFALGEKNHLKTSLKTGSFGLISPSVFFQQKLNSSLSLSTNAEWIKAHGRYKFRYKKDGGYDTTAVRQNGDITAFRSEMALHAKLGEKGKAMLKAYLYDSERGLPGAIVANRFSNTQRQWDRNFFIHGLLENSYFKNHNLLLNIKYSRDYNRYIDPDYKTTEGALDNKYYQNEFYVSLVNQYALKNWWSLSLATDFILNTLDANLYRFPYPTRYSYLGVLSSDMDWDRLTIQTNLLVANINEQVKYYQQGDNRKLFRPVISASFQPFDTKKICLRAFYKESFRMPTFNDLYYTFIGNSSLQPEFTTQYNLGTTWVIEPHKFINSVSFQTDIYYNRVKDKIIAMPSSNLFRWTMINLGKVDIKGLETNVNLRFQLPSELYVDLGFGYTYQKATDITPKSTTYKNQIPYTPKHSATLTSSIDWKKWQMNYSFIYTGERYSQKANIPVNYVKPWYTSDMALLWDGELFNIPVKIGAEINNLFNQYYDVVLNFPMPGRNYRFHLTINL